MAKYAKALKTLVKAGYARDKALVAVSTAFALTPEQIVILDRLTR